MAEVGEKTRFAMALFDDGPRLKAAAKDLVGLGLSPSSLCVAGDRAAIESGSADGWAGPDHTARIIPPERGRIALSIIPNHISWHANALIVQELEERTHAFAPSAPTTNSWDIIVEHLLKGALLLVALVPTAGLQNDAMRILLRYSRYPVHAEEFFRMN